MRIAWFRDVAPDATDPLDDSAPLIAELRATHHIDVVLEREAHEFVWQHFRQPWDLCVYELGATRAHQFMRAYLVNYPGVLYLRSTDVSALRVMVRSSRAVVVSDDGLAERLRVTYSGARIRVVPPSSGVTLPVSGEPGVRPHSVRFAVADQRSRGRDLVSRAFARARAAGAQFDVVQSGANTLPDCDVLVAPGWPPHQHKPTAVLAAMAAGKAVVTTEMEGTAGWPAIDPQTWRPRDLATGDAPIAVTLDPRDEEHSLMLAVRRLSTDAAAREQLGKAAHAWWKAHATPAHVAKAWTQVLEEAETLAPPARHAQDGTELARAIFTELGLPPSP